jgi:hypothetical protein
MRLSLLLGLSLAVACGSFGDGNGSSPDAGPGTPTGDASTDGAVTDGPADDDAAIPEPKPCGALYLCDEFERDNPFDGAKWTTEKETFATLTIETTALHKSATRSLVVNLPDAGDTSAQAFLRKDISPSVRRLTARFWLHVAQVPPSRDTIVAEMTTQNGFVFVMLQAGNLVVLAQTKARDSVVASRETVLTPGTGHDIVFDYLSVLQRERATVVVDKTVLDLPVGVAGGEVSVFEIGATYSLAGGLTRYHIDDVTLDKGL